MEELSYREFMEEARARLKNMSAEDVRELVLEQASRQHPSNRQEFLDGLTPPKQRKQAGCNEKRLMDRLEAFAERVEDGGYCSGWGWDDEIQEERDWGDESWAQEMDEFFLQARYLLMQGENELAEKVYRRLFEILETGQEPGHLPGDPDSSNMLKVDMDEQTALFLRSIYMNSSAAERPAILYEALKEYSYKADVIGLKNIIDVLDTRLPDIDTFLTEWVEFLKKQNDADIGGLLREAVVLKGGAAAISEFARQHADRYPMAYLDWIRLLEAEPDTDSVIQAAREGLSRIPGDYTVRARIAEKISGIGERLNDGKLKLEGYRESFYSCPSIRYLLDLYITAMECNCFEEVRDEAEKRVTELRARGRAPINDFNSTELATSFVSETVLISLMLLGGRYEKVFEMCRGKGSLGWSSGENPKSLFTTFMMMVLSKEGNHSKMLDKQWEQAIETACFRNDKGYVEKYRKLADIVKKSIQMTAEQEEYYLKWCRDEIGRRVDEIVSNQHRGSYYKAAGLLVAMAETLANREEEQEGLDFIEIYRNKYPKHSAFKGEVRGALQASGLFEGKLRGRGGR